MAQRDEVIRQVRAETFDELAEVSPVIARLRAELGAEFAAEMAAPTVTPKRMWSGGLRPNRGSQRRIKGQIRASQTYLAMAAQSRKED